MSAVNRHVKKSMDLEGNGRADWFFREWVYGIEIPSYHLDYSLTPAEQGKIAAHRQDHSERRVG